MSRAQEMQRARFAGRAEIHANAAELAGSAGVETAHVSEAIQYRSLDRVLKG